MIEEIPWDGIDQDGDGLDLNDVDGDGIIGVLAGGDDCNDRDPAVGPGLRDVVGDGVDADCDGWDGTGDASAAPWLVPWAAGAGLTLALLLVAAVRTARASVRARPSSRSAPRRRPGPGRSARPA